MRERGTGRLFQRGDLWWCQYYFHGEQIRVSTGETDEKKAGKFLKHKLAEVETHTHSDARNLRYEDLRDAYMDYFQTGKKKSLRFKDGKACLDTVARLDDFFAGQRAIEIDAPHIRKFTAGTASERSRGWHRSIGPSQRYVGCSTWLRRTASFGMSRIFRC